MTTDYYTLTDKDSLNSIIEAAERISSYNELPKKQALHLQLLCEELVCMLPEILTFTNGIFWIENTKEKYEIHTRINADSSVIFDPDNLLSIATNKKNSAKGFMNRLKSIIAMVAKGSSEASPYLSDPSSYYALGQTNVHGNAGWTLSSYRNQLENCKDTNMDSWDELEKSIIVGVADDISVFIVGTDVEIVITKSF